VARKLGVHRRMVREALRNALPPPRREPERAQPRLEPVKSFSDAMLEADRRAPRKQRHTAHRIYQRLRTEQRAAVVAESPVRRYVRLTCAVGRFWIWNITWTCYTGDRARRQGRRRWRSAPAGPLAGQLRPSCGGD